MLQVSNIIYWETSAMGNVNDVRVFVSCLTLLKLRRFEVDQWETLGSLT